VPGVVAQPGWQSWWVPAGQEADAVRAAREGDVPVLLIADSAETRTALPFMLARRSGLENSPAG
jgi:hypothetical protein